MQDHHRLHQHPFIGSSTAGIDVGGGGDRFPQWSIQETRDFLMLRAEFDQHFMETKRNKLLWDDISIKMKEKGYNRSPEQCKCKWKNLVSRYKGYETMETEGMRQQFPFYNELQAIFTGRMQRMLLMEAEGGGADKKRSARISSDEDDEDDQNEGSDDDGGRRSNNKKKKKTKKVMKGGGCSSGSVSSLCGNHITNSLKEIVEEFMKQQIQMEVQWMKAYEAREEERRMREMEWRQTMEALENERRMMDRRWRDREEQRRIREEARAEKRDALVSALLNKLRREDV